MKQPTLLETIAMRLLARQGIGVIWQLHLRASASHLDGNWLSAAALIGRASGCSDPTGLMSLWLALGRPQKLRRER